MKQIINKWDILLVAVLLVLSLIPEGIFYMTGNDAAVDRTYAVIQVDGKVYKEVPLSGHQGTDTIPIKTDDGYNLVVVKDDTIGIVEADCPDKICIGEGFISRPGATVVCLPHKLLIEVKSAGGGEPDVIPAH